MITDNSYSNVPGPIYYAKNEAMGAVAADAGTTSNALSPGETEVTINVNVMYQIK
jgi:uncharacterized protein YggE